MKDLENLLRDYYSFSPKDLEINASEKRERWKVIVKNSVRRSPMRVKFSTNSWPELKYEPLTKKTFLYYISRSSVLQIVKVKRPKLCDWWAAEMAVLQNLKERGYSNVEYVGDQRLGCDIICEDEKGGKVFVEVKSSTRQCTPTFTRNEWETAQQVGESYQLAVVENFSPRTSDVAFIQYVKNPGNLDASESRSVTFHLRRSQWRYNPE